MYTIQAGEMLVHGACAELPLTSHAVSVDAPTFHELVDEAGAGLPVTGPVFAAFRLAGAMAARVGAALDTVARSVVSSAPALAQQSAVQSLVAALLPALGRPPRPAGRRGYAAVRAARHHLEENVAGNVSLDDLASMTRTSKYHLARTFSQIIGVPPHTYQLHLRVARARRLLTSGVPPAETASILGFADQSHLGRHFRSVTRLTPAAYRADGWAPPAS
ncbi:MAG: helix-turn-helix domain-containing protein [Phycicoccus sp.]